jgi:photosystem II stability/assembly factor-like uncharacterized protein
MLEDGIQQSQFRMNNPKARTHRQIIKFFSVPLCLCGVILFSLTTHAQWIKQAVNTTASFRGLSVVNEKVVWASGTGGTVIKTTDGGKTWKVMTVPGAEKLDFRDIEAFDANTAYILSIGDGESSRIYKTTDGGKTWNEQFRNKNEKAFFDAIACWDKKSCIAMSDPVDGRYLLIATTDGGIIWEPTPSVTAPAANEGEAAFAASGTCLLTYGRTGVYLVSGGSDAHVFRSFTRGRTWVPSAPPFIKGTPGSGIFSIAMFDNMNGVIVGGNYEKPNEAKDNLGFTNNDGVTWTLRTGLSGYRSAVAYLDAQTIIAVGTNGTDVTSDGGKTWTKIGSEDLNTVAAKGKRAVWAVGAKGMVAKLK